MMLKNIWMLNLLCLSTFAYAGETCNQPNEYFVSISGGPSWTNAGKTQTIALQPDIIKTFVPDNLGNSNIMGFGEIFLGIQKSFFECLKSQFGLAVYLNSYAKLEGNILEDGDPNFQNYAYRYKINHEHIAIKSKWISENTFNMNPYLSASIGVGLNRSYAYSITPLISQEVSAPAFDSHTHIAFTYSLGVGLQHTVNQHFTIALGYQLVSWGSSALNRAAGQTSGHGLSLNNLYTQDLEFNVSYFI